MRCLILGKFETSFGLVYVIEFSVNDINPFIGQRLKYFDAAFEMTGVSFEYSKSFESIFTMDKKNYGIMLKEITNSMIILEKGFVLESIA